MEIKDQLDIQEFQEDQEFQERVEHAERFVYDISYFKFHCNLFQHGGPGEPGPDAGYCPCPGRSYKA